MMPRWTQKLPKAPLLFFPCFPLHCENHSQHELAPSTELCLPSVFTPSVPRPPFFSPQSRAGKNASCSPRRLRSCRGRPVSFLRFPPPRYHPLSWPFWQSVRLSRPKSESVVQNTARRILRSESFAAFSVFLLSFP